MKTAQQKVKEFVQKHNLTSGIEGKILMLTHEVGEIAKEGLKMSNYGKKVIDPAQPTGKMALELGEILYCVADMANALNIDLEEAFELALDHFASKQQPKQ